MLHSGSFFAACGIVSCREIELGPPGLGAQSLSHWTIMKSQCSSFYPSFLPVSQTPEYWFRIAHILLQIKGGYKRRETLSLLLKFFLSHWGSKPFMYVRQIINSAKEHPGQTQTKQPGALSPGHQAFLDSCPFLTHTSSSPHQVQRLFPAGLPLLLPLDYEDNLCLLPQPPSLMNQMESFQGEQGSRVSLSLLCPFGFCELDHKIFIHGHS